MVLASPGPLLTCVECSFGILVARWGILWKPLKVSLRQAPKIVGTCMCLHNVMIDRGVPQEIRPPVYSKPGRVTYRPHIDNNGAPTQLMTDDGADSTADCGGMTDLRSKLKSQMKELEMKRPQLAIERQVIRTACGKTLEDFLPKTSQLLRASDHRYTLRTALGCHERAFIW